MYLFTFTGAGLGVWPRMDVQGAGPGWHHPVTFDCKLLMYDVFYVTWFGIVT